jgi:hypothetical protein
MIGTTTVGVLISLSILLALGAGLSLVSTQNKGTDMEEPVGESLETLRPIAPGNLRDIAFSICLETYESLCFSVTFETTRRLVTRVSRRLSASSDCP